MRLFVAVNFPGPLREDIWAAGAPLREAGLPVRWIPSSALHVTLKFLGPTDRARLDEIQSALDTAAGDTRAFPLAIGGFGAFPSVERPRVIWVGCEGVPPMELLQHRLEIEMEKLGFEIEGRPFHPHVTLGRAQRDARPSRFGSLARVLVSVTYRGEAWVGSIELMESTAGRDGSRYRALHSVALGERLE
jgi:2'-5' RNA ligase